MSYVLFNMINNYIIMDFKTIIKIYTTDHCSRNRTVNVTLLYVVVSHFGKEVYLTSCVNAYNRNTCIHLPKNMLCERQHSSLLVKIAKHK